MMGFQWGAWKGFGEEGVVMVWDLPHGAETWAAIKAQEKLYVAEITMLRCCYKDG